MSFMIEQTFREMLQKNDLYRTRERVRIFQELSGLDTPCSLETIVQLTSGSVDRSTVYRTLDVFEKIGVISRVYTGWKYKVELSEVFRSHHHHMTCSQCFAVISFDEPPSFLEELKRLESSNGFTIKSHNLELSGLCGGCAKATSYA
jgi:Fur family ferric uptake transcriptional regulator